MAAAVNNTPSSSIPIVNPAKPSEKAGGGKIKDVAEKALEKEKKKETCKEFFARIWTSFCNTVKKIFSCLCKFFCFCCSGEDSSSEDIGSEDISDELSVSDPLEEVEEFFQEIYKGKVPPEIDKKLTELGLKKSKDTFSKEFRFRERRLEQLQVTTQKLGNDLSVRQNPLKFTLKGQYNPNNRCYMNSVLQCLEACYGVDSDECFKVISQDLSLQKGETLEGLEERLLKLWAPIPKMSEDERSKLSLKLLDKKTELEALKGVPEKGEAYKKEIIDLQKRLRNREDRILFKWSYLLLLQAKFKGTSENIDQALKFHKNTCFELALHPDFKNNPEEQKDAAAYQEYWNDMLEVAPCPVGVHRVANFEGKEISSKMRIAPERLLQIELSGIKEAGSLVQLIRKKFCEKKTPQDKVPYNFKLPDKSKIPMNTYDIISEICSAPPKFLTFHFKRFVTKFENNKCVSQKISDPLPVIPEADLKKADFSSLIQKNFLAANHANYELKGFVVHAWGSLENGHYVAYVKRDGQWFYISDSTWRPIDEKTLPVKDAYMVFYALSASK